jgi:hypothetical protein
MDAFTRRSFVKSLGLAAGLGSIPTIVEAQSESAIPDVPMPVIVSDRKACAFDRFIWIFTPRLSLPMWGQNLTRQVSYRR